MLESTLITYTREIALAHQEIKAASQNIVEKACEIGRKLSILKKDHVKHGGWLSYLERHLPEISERTAQVYMLVYEHQDKWKSVATTDLTDEEATPLTLAGIRDIITDARGKKKKEREPKCPLKQIKKAFRELPKSYQKPFLEYLKASNLMRGSAKRDYDKDGWGTPENIIDLVRQVLGTIELDVASSDAHQMIIQADRYFTQEQDGLKRKWSASTVFMNPPYSASSKWVPKALHEFKSGNMKEMILLMPDDSKCDWSQTAWKKCNAVCMTNGVMKFRHPNTNKDHGTSYDGNHIFYFGPNAAKFVQVFSTLGLTISNTWSLGEQHHDNAIIIKEAECVPDLDGVGIKIKSKNGRASKQANRRSPAHQVHVVGSDLI